MPRHKKIKTEVSATEVVNLESEPDTSNNNERNGILDWRDRCRNVRDMYRYIFEDGLLSDVKLVVGQPGTVFHCHRLILAVGSSVFEAMFFGPLAEKGDSVNIPDMDPEGFRHLLRFLYTGEYDDPADESAFKIYFAADKYCVNKLKSLCEDTLFCCDLTAKNVWTFLENALLLNSAALKLRCLETLSHHADRWIEESSFSDISFNTLQTLLDIDELDVSEEKLCRSVISWAIGKSEKEGGDSFENTMKRLLPSIRFSALTAKEFIQLQNNTRLGEVLSDRDNLSILQHLVEPEHCKLPDWCCPKKKRSVIDVDFSSVRMEYRSYLSLLSPSSTSKKRKYRSELEDRHSSIGYLSTSSSLTSTSSSSDSSSSSSDFSD